MRYLALGEVVELHRRLLEATGAVLVMTELGDITRFDNPRQLMRDLGLTPSEYSSGERRRQGGITKAGNSHARRALVDGAWAGGAAPVSAQSSIAL